MENKNASHNRMSASDRQHQLLEVAMSAFSRRGFKGTTTKEIAAEAGVTEAVIFQHFPSKEALYSAVLDLHFDAGDEEKWIEEVSALMEGNNDEAVFLSFVRRIISSYRSDPELERVILFSALEGHEQGMARLQRQFAPTVERFIEYVIRRQREGALFDCNPHAIVIGIGGIAHQYGLITQIFRAPGPDVPDEEMARLFTRLLLHGIRASGISGKSPKQKPANKSKRKAK